MNLPNDVIVRLTRDAAGKLSHDVLIALNDESMLDDLGEVAEFIGMALDNKNKTDGEEGTGPLAYIEQTGQGHG